jgi:hypothetical protein
VEELCNSFERTKEQRAAIEATVLERQIDDATLRKQQREVPSYHGTFDF